MDEEITLVYEQLSDLAEPTRNMSPEELRELLVLATQEPYEIHVTYEDG